MEDNMKVICIAHDRHQAQLVMNLLAEHEISAYLVNEPSDTAHDPAGTAARGGIAFHRDQPRVLVAADDAERAREIIGNAEQARSRGHSSPGLARLEDEAERDSRAWPACASCGRRRHTSCPVCETAGTDFPEAFLPDDEPQSESADARHGRSLLVLCTTCDEPFEPEFPARCEWCGYRFADGWEPPSFVAPEPADINLRVVITIAGLVLAALALVAFFAMLLSESEVEGGAGELPSPLVEERAEAEQVLAASGAQAVEEL